MKFDDSILRNDEKAVFALRRLYSEYHYEQYKMSKFEEYDLYSKNKDFLVSDGIITFNDTNGKLLALKPDVTLSIIKNSKDIPGYVQKVYYNENVYRISESSHTYKEIMQTGLECIGDITDRDEAEVVTLAVRSLSLIAPDFVLNLCHIGLVFALLQDCGVRESDRGAVMTAITRKNPEAFCAVCTPAQRDFLKCLMENGGSAEDAVAALKRISVSAAASAALGELLSVYDRLRETGFGDRIRIDFSILDSAAYYSGIVFKGYISGISSRVLSGGRYDMLMRKMGRSAGAVGFAVYLDALERPEKITGAPTGQEQIINVALPKGRLGEKVYAMFESAGFDCPAIRENNRRLVFENRQAGVRFFWVKPSDVAIYVERGAADIGVAGKDILLEYEPDVYEMLDLGIGRCRMAVAAKKDYTDDTSRTLRVATKFANITRKFYAEKCRDIDIIHLNGSIELAPILGLSDVIVDIVETGKTLLENDLAPVETVVPVSARFISNKASYQFKSEQIDRIIKGLSECVEKNKND